ncbi:hypothetical protein IAT38_008332 [Cryptococcus sp. DSM 104549]
MSSRRPADDPAAGQPDSKRTKTAAPPLDIAAIRAQLAAKKAQLEAQSRGTASPAPPSHSASPAPPSHVAPKPALPAPGPAALPPKLPMSASIQEKLAAAKARIEALNARQANPYLSGGAAGGIPNSTPAPAQAAPGSGSASPAPQGVSGVALHPLLMSESQQAAQAQEKEKNEKRAMRDRYKTMAPKFTSVKANASVAAAPGRGSPAAAPVLNPYAAGSVAAPDSSTPEEKIVVRRSKKLNFSKAGKYVEQGEQLRNEQKMEALRQRIAEASRKAGLDSEFDTLERNLKKQPPPDIEWWDKVILPAGTTYDDDIDAALEESINADMSPITHLIQHPIPIAAPQDRKQPERGLMLTKKEAKKMRRQRRQAELEDKRDRQKMGLLPPDPPKVRLANLMKVLTSDAVQDPTKVEAKVRKEVAMRAYKHEKDNNDRKLTAEERKEKEYQQMLAREQKGIHAAVFKIKYLTNGRHKFKVRETAKSDLLTGLCIYHPSFALVLVEGTDKGMKHYKKLMLSRIDWTEQARPLGEEGDASGSGSGSEGEGGGKGKAQDGDQDLADNKCELLWEGEVPERSFRMFKPRHVESDMRAREWLTQKYEGMWDLAKRYKWDGEDL